MNINKVGNNATPNFKGINYITLPASGQIRLDNHPEALKAFDRALMPPKSLLEQILQWSGINKTPPLQHFLFMEEPAISNIIQVKKELFPGHSMNWVANCFNTPSLKNYDRHKSSVKFVMLTGNEYTHFRDITLGEFMAFATDKYNKIQQNALTNPNLDAKMTVLEATVTAYNFFKKAVEELTKTSQTAEFKINSLKELHTIVKKLV